MYQQIQHPPNKASKSRNSPASTFFQPKLTVNQPNDVYEQEADKMADKVMRVADLAVNQNAFFKADHASIQRKCQACEEDDHHVQRQTSNGNEIQGSTELDSYVGSLSSSGQPMPETSRKFFEPRFGHDFSNVRIHNDSVAAKSAQSINAMAYTTGNNIVFNSNRYTPETEPGQRLLAHELTHVIQQSAEKPAIQRHRLLDAKEAAPCLAKAEETIQKLEKSMLAGAKFGQQPYILGAVKILRDKMSAGKIKCYAFDGLVHGVTDYSGDEIRLDGININWLEEGTLLHEGVHAYHASQYTATAAKYAAALNSQKAIDGNKKEDLKLLKWKAWTEYWAYRSKMDYFNPTMQTPRTPDEIDNLAMADPNVKNPTSLVWRFDPEFRPIKYTPQP